MYILSHLEKLPEHKVQRNDTRIERVRRGSRFPTQHRSLVVPDGTTLKKGAIAFYTKPETQMWVL